MSTRQRILVGVGIVWLAAGTASALLGQSPAPVAGDNVTAMRELMALTYPEGNTIHIKFHGTHRLPNAEGQAKVERKRGITEIEFKADRLKPATLFGGDYNTYVLWTISPEGQANNVGELVMKNTKTKLNVSTPMQTFGMMVTAEPHFLVTSPSRFIVMENTRPSGGVYAEIKTAQVKYRGSRIDYRFQRETLASMPAPRGEVRTDLEQALTAVRLAESAGADRFAAQELAQARDALQKTEAAARAGSDPRSLTTLGHEAVRLAAEAQKLAEERSAQAALQAERQAHASQTAALQQEVRQAQTEAEQRERRAAEEARRRREAEASARQAQQQAQQAQQQAQQAEQQARQAEQQAQQLAVAKSEAELAAERARRESEEARNQMREALARVVETRQTARGLILNLPDILFDTGKATLHPQAREVLSKIAGILLVAGGYRLSVEGHTDNVGNPGYNLKLSERRAESVRDYLVQAGVSSSLITTRGFGESQPITSNATPAGRQKNRRVEIVIEEMKEFRFKP